MARRFSTPPNWPAPPEGWTPPAGWQPLPEWGPAPAGWQFWVDDDPPAARPSGDPPAAHPLGSTGRIPIFGARARAKELGNEVEQLRAEMARLGTLDVADLERRRNELRREVQEQESALAQAQREHQAQLERQSREAAERQREAVLRVEAELRDLTRRLTDLRQDVVVTEEAAILQEIGIYQYRHPLSDAAAYQAALARLQDQIKVMAKKDGGAIEAATGWTVNGSAAQGRTMINNYSKLMLRTYNAEADNLVRGLKPYKLDSGIDRLNKVAATIERLGKTMSIRISRPYHQLRVQELELTADYLEKVAVEKEREREEKERLREERKVQLEIERERQRLEKERQHYANALKALLDAGDEEAAKRLRDQLDEVERAISDVDYRAANVRAGYVYVISNVGAFGPGMIKVGMTRRLDPMDRVRELSDASVPFNFDVHALFFSANAAEIEAKMHARLADRRVNRVNMRREFFRATPAEAREHLLELTGDLLQFEELPEALEYHQSVRSP